MKFDKKIFLENLDYYMNKNSIKSSELEQMAGVSKGYISRIKKADNKSVPGVDFLLVAASLFGITVESLCMINYMLCTENEKYYVDFFNDLITRTIKKDILWKHITSKQFIDKIDNKSDEEIIIEREPSVLSGISEAWNGKRRYASTFEYGDYKYCDTEGNFYSLKIDNQHSLYMVKVILSYQEELFSGIEMFMISNHKKSNVCCISPQNIQLYDDMFFKLYNTVKDSINVNYMDQETKNIIDKFIKQNK